MQTTNERHSEMTDAAWNQYLAACDRARAMFPANPNGNLADKVERRAGLNAALNEARRVLNGQLDTLGYK